MRLRALKILRSADLTADPGDEFDCDDTRAAGLLDGGAAEPVAAKVETAAEQVEVETAEEAPPPPPAKPKETPRKRKTRKVNPRKKA